MNFDFTEEQKLFADSVRRFAQTHLTGMRSHAPTPRDFPSTWPC
jgi:alkylation response protein AidB-like acyl-CoA dehydrogenase